jgi:hypothetical protein
MGAATERIKTWRKGRKLYSCRQDTIREKRQEAIQLQTGYKHGGKTGSYTAADRIQAGRKDREICSCRQDTEREERQGAIQLQTGYRHGGKAESYTAADRIQAGRKDRKLCSCRQILSGRKERELGSCRQDTRREERQRALQLQTGYKEGGKTGSCAAADRIQAERKDKSNAAKGGGLRAIPQQTEYMYM